MGAVHGERVVRAYRRAIDERLPLVALTASGGARMQEGMVVARSRWPAPRRRRPPTRRPGCCRWPCTATRPPAACSRRTARWPTCAPLSPGATVGFAGPRVVELATGEALPPNVAHRRVGLRRRPGRRPRRPRRRSRVARRRRSACVPLPASRRRSACFVLGARSDPREIKRRGVGGGAAGAGGGPADGDRRGVDGGDVVGRAARGRPCGAGRVGDGRRAARRGDRPRPPRPATAGRGPPACDWRAARHRAGRPAGPAAR